MNVAVLKVIFCDDISVQEKNCLKQPDLVTWGWWENLMPIGRQLWVLHLLSDMLRLVTISDWNVESSNTLNVPLRLSPSCPLCPPYPEHSDSLWSSPRPQPSGQEHPQAPGCSGQYQGQGRWDLRIIAARMSLMLKHALAIIFRLLVKTPSLVVQSTLNQSKGRIIPLTFEVSRTINGI